MTGRTDRRRVVVVTGGAIGIGAAIAEACAAAGAFVVTMDPGLALDGTRADGGTDGPTTAARIVAAGGAARASGVSVTDAAEVSALFAGLAEEHGALDAVVNVAGITRTTGFAKGDEDDWAAVLDVHLEGYRTVLGAALPVMEAQGHGRIVGVTSGSGWRAADAGAYGCAKRAVAALTWAVARMAPPGVTVNALSPIAATRMVAHALAGQRAAGNASGASAASGGVGLAAAPPPARLGPIGAHLAGEGFAWCNGAVLFANGAEVSPVAPPRPLEVVGLPAPDARQGFLDRIVPAVLAPAETAQRAGGTGMGRLVGDDDEAVGSGPVRRCLVVGDDPAWCGALSAALGGRGIEVIERAATSGFGAAGEVLTGAGPVDAVVVAPTGQPSSGAPGWRGVLADHAGLADAIRRDAAWFRAVADDAARTARPVRVVVLVDADGPGGSSRAMSAAQLSRAAHAATDLRVDACVIAVEGAGPAVAADLASALIGTVDLAPLSGAELFVGTDRVGLRSHPEVLATVTTAGRAPGPWLDDVLRELLDRS